MRPTFRVLSTLSRSAHVQRGNTTGFIGLGRMGYEMAFNLFSKTLVESGGQGSLHFVVCDAVQDTAHRFARNFNQHYPGAHIEVRSTPAEVVKESQTVITMLPSSPHVLQVYTGGEGSVLPALQSLSLEDASATFCIDSTTLDVGVARDVAMQVHARGAIMVDAPVSGGVAGAKAGSLSFLVGGTTAAFEHANPLLLHMGKKIFHCGPSGSGLAAKICNNLVLGVQQIVVGEAMLLGQKLGLDPAVLAGVINSSTGGCWASAVNNPVPGALPDKEPPCTKDYEGGFAMSLMLKDMGLATEAADVFGCPLPMGESAEKLYGEIIETEPEYARKDFSSVYRYLRVSSDGEIRKGRPGQSERV